MAFEVQEVPIASDDVFREALDGRRDVDVIRGVGLDEAAGDFGLLAWRKASPLSVFHAKSKRARLSPRSD